MGAWCASELPLLVGLGLGAAACNGAGPGAAPANPAASTRIAGAPAPSSTLGVGGGAGLDPGARRPIGRARAERLPFELRAEPTGDGVLLIGHDERPEGSFVRRIDAAGVVGPVLELRDRPVASLGGARPLLVTSDGLRLCIAPLDAQESAGNGNLAEQRCVRAEPLALAPFDGAIALLEELTEPDDAQAATPDGGTGARRTTTPGPTEPVRIRVGLRRLTLETAGDSVAQDTGLAVQWPLPGMNVVGAVPTSSGIAVAWYEHLRFFGRGRGRRADAELRAGTIDSTGHFVPASRVKLAAGPREFGSIEGHLEPRLVSADGRAAFVGRTLDPASRTKRFGYEARRLDSARPHEPAPVVCRIDPAALARSSAPTDADLERLEAIARLVPELAPGQPRAEIEQVAWSAERGYFLAQGGLRSVARSTGEVREEAWPFLGERDRVLAAAFNRAGEAVALTTSRVAELSADGTLDERDVANGSTAHDAPRSIDGEGFGPIRPARVGSAWWAIVPAAGAQASGWRLARIGESPAPAAEPAGDAGRVWLEPSSSALAGGAVRGQLLTVGFDHAGRGSLEVNALEPDGAVNHLASHPAVVTAELVAAERRAGGALVVGRGPLGAEHLVGVAIDGRGAIRSTARLELGDGPDAGPLELRTMPNGGALLSRQRGAHLLWLDDDARPLGAKTWPAERSQARCLDGQPGRTWVASPEPGALVRVAELGRPGTCVVAGPQWAPDGSLRWIGSRAAGMDNRAEVGLVRLEIAGGGAATTRPSAANAAQPDAAPPTAQASPPPPTLRGAFPCPADMVYAAGRFCIDRYEARLADAQTALPLAPDWPATPGLSQAVLASWTTGRWRAGNLHAQAQPLPPLLRPVGSAPVVVARSVLGVRPSGYLTGLTAELACQSAGKRLCTSDEFLLACRGEEDRKFPYGAAYVDGACNVFREVHPASVLHGNAAVGHLDPRLNRVLDRGEPLLRPTGSTPRCRSRWGEDYVYDLVGNLDEWLADPKGSFAGGFYARATRAGCDALITAHPRRYLDYSTGTRCCRDAEPPPG